MIAYEIDDKLYLNITNRCSNDCDFCVRRFGGVNNELFLEQEPTADEVLKAIDEFDIKNYTEIVFCGYGEPTEALDVLVEVIKKMKDKIKIRINTNGQGNLINGRDITPELCVDAISISLNAKNAEEYDEICHSIYGADAFYAILDFAKRASLHVPEVIMSVVDCIGEENIKACQIIAEQHGAKLRVREEIKE